jgi:glycosyltransferase involved in cell wall biosynthesis
VTVCLVARRIWTHGLGGMEEQSRSLAAGLAQEGHVVHVVTTSHPARPPTERAHGGTLHYLPGTPPGDYSAAWWRESRRWASTRFEALGIDAVLSMSMAAYGLVGAGRPIYTMIVGWGLNQLRSYWQDARGLRGLVQFPYSALTLLAALPRARVLLRASARVLAASRDIERQLHRYRPCFLPNSVDTAEFRPDPAARARVRRELGLADGDCLALMVSTVTWQKGVHLGLRACAAVAREHPGVAAAVIGDGPAAAAVEAETRRDAPHLRAAFLGARPHEAVAPFFAAADVFLMPSLRQEAMPTTSVLEAMASGLPVVAMRPGAGAIGVVDGASGFVVDQGDQRGFTAALREMAADPDRRRAMGQAARAMAVAEFDQAVVARRLAAIMAGAPC